MTTQQTVKIQLVRSPIGTKESHRATVRGLGLRKLNSISELQDVNRLLTQDAGNPATTTN